MFHLNVEDRGRLGTTATIFLESMVSADLNVGSMPSGGEDEESW
uniref:Uncharacterized protein n=1 Tax=Peronospora matthiolae TaxID=2874970 RepID=A0AAV1UHN0_9STRA